jgi:hypothetical protein
MDGVASSHLGLLSRILLLAEVYGPAVILTNHREVPLSERRMVLYTYSAPDVSPADPCNKVAPTTTRPSSPIRTALRVIEPFSVSRHRLRSWPSPN